MRTNRALAIAAAFGFGVSFGASANVIYDSETTNEWFNANVATSSALDSWSKKPSDGEAIVMGEPNAHYIALDTDLDDPLVYTAAGASADIAVVAAEMTATVNANPPQIDAAPQAALAVVGDATAAKWVGLVGKKGGGTEWVTFQSPEPVVGDSYSVRIEFDQRETRRIRYLINGVVLSGEGSTDGWYPNPQASAAMNISNVSFSGSGDIKALAGENITENTIAFKTPTETEGYDYTNGAISVSADIQGYTGVTATLMVKGTDGEVVSVVPQTPGSANWSWNLNDLTQGEIYTYTIEAKDVGGKIIATKTGTFTAAKWPANIWFGADASKSAGSRETGGHWADAEPVVENATYVIDEGAVFNVDDQEPGSNHVTRVDTKVTFETLVDANSLLDVTDEQDALGGFVAAKSGEIPQWMALTKKDGAVKWVALSGGIEPEVNVPYVIRAEVDFISDVKRVRFLVSDGTGETFAPLSYNGNQWIQLATQAKYSLAAVELKGSGKVAKFEATVADKALAVVDGVEYDSMDEALAAAKDGTKSITLLTNATVEPTDKGSYDIVPGGHHYMFGGNDSTEARTIVVTGQGQPPVVRPSTATMKDVQTPDGAHFRNIDTLRTFLENNKVSVYTSGNGSSTEISGALQDPGKNGLPLWEDYVMGIEQTDSVTPEYTPSTDEDPQNFSLQVPDLGAAIRAGKPSGDYAIKYRIDVNKVTGTSVTMPDTGIIPVALPVAAADYNVRIVLEPIE